MAGKRLTMRQIREILRLRWDLKRTVREVALALGLSTGVVSKVASRAQNAGLQWPAVGELSESELRERLYGRPAAPGTSFPEPDPAWLYQELKKPGVTLVLLHLEYLAEHPHGMQYTAFAARLRRWKRARKAVLRQEHKAGERLFVDFSGKKPHYVDRHTGEKIEVELFVAAWGASSYTFADVAVDQRIGTWIEVNRRAIDFGGGVTRSTVPDNLKSAVERADPYDPMIQETFADFGRHYGTAIVPARPYRARDKAKVEAAVLVAQRWILARLRNETFFSFAELRARVRELNEELNDRPRKHLGGVTRRELFERIERPALQPIPAGRFEASRWQRARVNLDYHVQIERHYYSVPHALIHETVEARVTAATVEIFLAGKRVAVHPYSAEPYRHTTDPTHRPSHHRQWLEADPGQVLAWAQEVGPHAAALVQRILDRSPFPETAWRSARGLRRVGERYGHERCEEACRRALLFGARSYRPVAEMLKHGLDQQPLGDESEDDVGVEHDQIRGPEYFH